MKRINNVDIDKVKSFGDQIKSDPSKARKTQVIEEEWLVKEEGHGLPLLERYEGLSE